MGATKMINKRAKQVQIELKNLKKVQFREATLFATKAKINIF